MYDAAPKADSDMVGDEALSFADSSSGRGWGESPGDSVGLAPPLPRFVECLADGEFRTELATLIPKLRAFARSLCRNREHADDLTQEAMLKAWEARSRFQAGTNLRAWVFVILRNIFLSQMRRARFAGEWDEDLAARVLSTPPSQEHHLQFGDLQRAMDCLPEAQRQALVLVAAGGFSCEEAAKICCCALGTIKSRVARAREALERMLADGSCPPRAASRTQSTGAAESLGNELDRIVGFSDRRGEACAPLRSSAWQASCYVQTAPPMLRPGGAS